MFYKHLFLVAFHTMFREWCSKASFFSAQHLEDEEPNDVVFYVLLRAVDRFYEEYNLYPGFYTQQVESDVNKLKVSILYLSRIVRKREFCLGENKGTDQLHSNCEADQRLCFRYTDSTTSFLLKCEISSF